MYGVLVGCGIKRSDKRHFRRLRHCCGRWLKCCGQGATGSVVAMKAAGATRDSHGRAKTASSGLAASATPAIYLRDSQSAQPAASRSARLARMAGQGGSGDGVNLNNDDASSYRRDSTAISQREKSGTSVMDSTPSTSTPGLVPATGKDNERNGSNRSGTLVPPNSLLDFYGGAITAWRSNPLSRAPRADKGKDL